MGILREFLKFYRERKEAERKLKRAACLPFDYAFIQGLVNTASASPVLLVVEMKDGTRLEIRRDERNEGKRDWEKLL